MLLKANIKMALNSIKQAKVHSFLTMFGIIVGISSVVTMVSLGEGFKQQIRAQTAQTGESTITVRPGQLVSRDDSGKVEGINFFNSFSGSNITEQELNTISQTPEVQTVVPFSIVTGVPSLGETIYHGGSVLATNENAPAILNQKVQFGYFFGKEEAMRNVVVLGRAVADELFKEQAPIGKTLTIRGQEFIIIGVFEEFPSISVNVGKNFNKTVFIPYAAGKKISGGNLPIFEVLVTPTSSDKVDMVAAEIRNRLIAAHQGQEDFTVLKSEENIALADNILSLATALIAGIAAISLLVGGIGIMNIMFALVTERTHEIGVRKAIGASNQQILGQFLIEAITLSAMGGIIGIIISFIANAGFRIFTELEPVINVPILLIATGVSIGVGVLSGVIPALRAARKDPIEALRYL